MNINDIFECEITSLDHQGRGISRIDNKIIFISRSLPMEVVKIKITNIKKNYLEGEVLEIIKPSSLRIKPLCPYFDECGGCDLLHISYEEQLKYKEEKIKDIMLRYAGIDNVDNIVKSVNPINYRNKATFQVNNVIGMYKKRSYDIIPIDECLIADEKINKYLKILQKKDLNGIKQIIIRSSKNEVMIILVCDKDINIDLSDIDANVIKKYKDKYIILKGNDYIVDTIGSKEYKISPSSFFQVNKYQTSKLYDKVLEYLDLKEEEKVLDLYCGTGTIGIYIADKAKEVLGIEINEDAIKDAKENAKLNNIDNITFIAGDASKIIKDINYKPDKIIVDPPRAGLDKKVIDKIISMNPQKIVYVSCDPVTLARDLKILKDKYTVEKVIPVDMFPNTMHLETICIMKKL